MSSEFRHQGDSASGEVRRFTRNVLTRDGEEEVFVKAAVDAADAAWTIEGGSPPDPVTRYMDRKISRFKLPDEEVARAWVRGKSAFAALWQINTGQLPQTVLDFNAADKDHLLEVNRVAEEERQQRVINRVLPNEGAAEDILRINADRTTHDLSNFPEYFANLPANRQLRHQMGQEKFDTLVRYAQALVNGEEVSKAQMLQDGLIPQIVRSRTLTALRRFQTTQANFTW